MYQVFKGNIPLNPSEKENLGEHENHMIQLAYGHVPYKEKKTILVQHGVGFVDTLLKPVITALAYAMLWKARSLEQRSFVGLARYTTHVYHVSFEKERTGLGNE